MRVRFAWDEKKNKANQLKHRIGFEAAMLVFDDPTSISVQDRDTEGEQQWITVGWVQDSILLVAHTRSYDAEEEVIRIMSGWKASPSERKLYVKETQ